MSGVEWNGVEWSERERERERESVKARERERERAMSSRVEREWRA